MMGLGREGHDQVERGIVQIAASVCGLCCDTSIPISSMTVGGERVRHPCLHAGGVDVAAASGEVAQDCGPHH